MMCNIDCNLVFWIVMLVLCFMSSVIVLKVLFLVVMNNGVCFLLDLGFIIVFCIKFRLFYMRKDEYICVKLFFKIVYIY